MDTFVETISAVLPCVAGDFPRARLLLRSLAVYKNPIGCVYVVCPSSQVSWFEAQLEQMRARRELDGGSEIVILDEASVVPEINHLDWLRGWMKQQLVKLAIAHRAQTRLYITFDADVVLTRDTTWSDFAEGERALYAEMHVTPHTAWYRGSARALGIEPQRDQREHNVTPALLHRDAVLLLAAFLEQRATIIRHSWAPLHLFPRYLLSRKDKRFPVETRTWTLYLAGFAQRWFNEWTEYSLYYRFLESTGKIDAYHHRVQAPLYDNALSVRRGRPEKFDSIDWGAVFQQGQITEAQRAHRPFVIVQSVANIPFEKIEGTFSTYLGLAPQNVMEG